MLGVKFRLYSVFLTVLFVLFSMLLGRVSYIHENIVINTLVWYSKVDRPLTELAIYL